MVIQERLVSREHNNFNILRLLAAVGVIITHAYALLGLPQFDWLKRTSLGLISFSKLGVYVFFVISGFLVTRSLENSATIKSFFWKRFLRIFPAMVVVIGLAVFVLGPLVTEAPLGDYFTSLETYRYLGGSFLYFITYSLPGVFLNNPYPGAVNGSLWTLPYEWACYCLLACLAPLIRKRSFIWLAGIAAACMATRTLLGHYQVFLVVPFVSIDTRELLLFAFLFFWGAAAGYVASYIRYNFLAVCLALVALGGLLFFHKKLASYWLLIILPFITVWLAAIPLPAVIRRWFNQADFSYGMYIYAFPVAQLLVYSYRGFTVTTFALATIFATLPLAMLSWYLVEKPALALKKFPPI